MYVVCMCVCVFLYIKYRTHDKCGCCMKTGIRCKSQESWISGQHSAVSVPLKKAMNALEFQSQL